MDPLITSSLIGGAFNLAGGLFGRSKTRGIQKEMQELQHAGMTYDLERQKVINQTFEEDYRAQREREARMFGMAEESFSERNHQIALRVADAKAAGLHPLYALGAAVNGYSPSFSVGGPEVPNNAYSVDGQQESGSFAGDAFSAVGDAFARYSAGVAERDAKREAKAQADRRYHLDKRRVDAMVSRDEAEAEYYRSQAARARQATNATRPAYDEDGQMVVPAGVEPPAFNKLPTKVLPKEMHPNKVRAQGARGEDFFSYAPPGLGGDEINQVIWLTNRAIEEVSDMAKRAFGHGKGGNREKAKQQTSGGGAW